MNEMGLAFFEQHLKIDKHNLDDEFVRQPVLYQQVADEWALAISRRDKAKDALKRVVAKVVIALKKGPEKMTELQLNSIAEVHPKVIAAKDVFFAAAEEASRLEGMKEAYSMRSYALRDVKDLYTTSYYQTPHSGNEAAANDVDARRKLMNQQRNNQNL